jgi:hypothetical protein
MEMINRLLKSVHNFFPVGVSSIMEDYDGYEKYSSILNKKINDVINGTTEKWNLLKVEIANLNQEKLIDLGYNQFPSFIAKIEIPTKGSSEDIISTEIIVNISLLCNFYTIFARKFYQVGDDLISNGKSRISVLYGLGTNEIGNQIFDCDRIKESIESIFDGYTFVAHKILFDLQVEGAIPYTESLDIAKPSYSVYHLLFDSLFVEKDIVIID